MKHTKHAKTPTVGRNRDGEATHQVPREPMAVLANEAGSDRGRDLDVLIDRAPDSEERPGKARARSGSGRGHGRE